MKRALKILIAAGCLAVPMTLVLAAPSGASTMYYVSLGDSYSIGYQPGTGPTTGYTGIVAAHTGFQLENFGCGGATTGSLLSSIGCGSPAGTDAVAYPTQTQIDAADAFITAHPGQIGLVTVSIGGNDITSCVNTPDPVVCVAGALAPVQTNVTTIATDLRTALGTAGKKTPIIGLTYPDVILGAWVNPGGSSAQSLATESVFAFKSLINPELKKAYKSGKGKFVDVTKKTGAYVNLKKTTTLAPYGTIPVAVADVCTWTYYCSQQNIHANTAGYTLIGNLIDKLVK